MEELKGELGELEPELKGTQEEGQRLTHALAQQRTQVGHIRDQLITHEEKVKVSLSALCKDTLHRSQKRFVMYARNLKGFVVSLWKKR